MTRCASVGPLGFVFLTFLFLEPHAAGQSSGCEAPVPSERLESTKIKVVSVEFSGDSPLSDEDRAEFTNTIQNRPLVVEGSQPDANSFDSDTEFIRDSLRNRGYFKAVVTGTPFLIRATREGLEYALRIEVESGPLYHVGEISLTNSPGKHPLVFEASILRQRIPLEVGDVFDVSKLRDGLSKVTRLYQTKGYVDVTIEPDFEIKEIEGQLPAIDVVLKIDEQIPYRLRSVSFLGLDQRTPEQLSSPQQAGDLFNWPLWLSFFRVNQRLLPFVFSLSENVQLHKDTENAAGDIVVDFNSHFFPSNCLAITSR